MSTNHHPGKANRLINEKSPYLLQHAYNPINWYPWGKEAFIKAKFENKPIFLSIGYSTCHWCHVMERESFEDEEVAELMNREFVAIKVDREERPDIDHIYMSYCQALTGQGGWPLTIVMTPDQKPFFAGTYFPKLSRYGRPGVMDVLSQLSQKWKEDPNRIVETSEQMLEHMKTRFEAVSRGKVNPNVLEIAAKTYKERFDPVYGGFGSEPKFPSPHNLLFLLRYGHQKQDPSLISMVEKTLDAMADGGIYDHIGYGFARYSVDRQWLVPHFEKMLYDNALLAIAYLEAFQVTGKERYAQIAKEIFAYVEREMTHPEGGFYSAEDADSEGEEGKFYVWRPEEILQVLGEELGKRYCRYYGITSEGNFEGHNIPNLIHQDLAKFCSAEGIDPNEWLETVKEANRKLFEVRDRRIHPYKDDKILTAWNALMICAFAKGARVLQESHYLQTAERAAKFLLTRLVNENGTLFARYRDGEAAYPAYLDDYAFWVWALIELYETSYAANYFELALQWNQEMKELFWDEQGGGYFFYGKHGEELIARPKEIYDGAIPSGNSVAALNLLRLASMTGNPELASQSEAQIEAFAEELNSYPPGYSYFLLAIQFWLGPTREIVLAGDLEQEDTKRLKQIIQTLYLPLSVQLFHPESDGREEIEKLADFIRGQRAVNGKATLYSCENFACQAPITDVEEAIRILSKK